MSSDARGFQPCEAIMSQLLIISSLSLFGVLLRKCGRWKVVEHGFDHAKRSLEAHSTLIYLYSEPTETKEGQFKNFRC